MGKMGYVITEIRVQEAVLQGNGSLVLIGSAGYRTSRFSMARYDETGSKDTTFYFDKDSIPLTNSGAYYNALKAAVDHEDRIVVTGTVEAGNGYRYWGCAFH